VTARDQGGVFYGTSVAAALTGVDPQMLRIYEARGLVEPARTDGGNRRYSPGDIERIDRITTLLAAGLNLAGIAQVLALEARTRRLRGEVESLRLRAPEGSRSGPPDETSSHT